jgi:hypothetical protein
MDRLIAAFCSNGPYRHLRQLVCKDTEAWFPWGYRHRTVEAELDPKPGDLVEFWEVDEIRDPQFATPVCVASIDYVANADGYLALTLRTLPSRACHESPDNVISAVSRRMLFSAGVGTRGLVAESFGR